MQFRTCGGYWTSLRARPASPSPRAEEPAPAPDQNLDPIRVGPTRQPAHRSLRRPMEKWYMDLQNQRRPSRRFRRASIWQQFIRYRSSRTSTTSSLSLTSLRLSYVRSNFTSLSLIYFICFFRNIGFS